MGVSFPVGGVTRIDTGSSECPAAFVLICLVCYNLGRLDHQTIAVIDEGESNVIYHCLTCGARYDVPEPVAS